MKLLLSLLFCATLIVGEAAVTQPRFQLSAGDSGGMLGWRSHTFVPDGDQLVPKEDYVVEDKKAGVISVCLEWQTEPDAASGEFLTVFGAWAIPASVLQKETYVLSVERHSAESIAFTLSTLQGVLLLKSKALPMAKGWRGPVNELGKHITPVPAAALEKK